MVAISETFEEDDDDGECVDENLKRMPQSVPHKMLGQAIGGVFCHLCISSYGYVLSEFTTVTGQIYLFIR